MSEELLDEIEARQTKLQRPGNLTVLCLLTWIACVPLFFLTISSLMIEVDQSFDLDDWLHVLIMLSLVGSAAGSVLMFSAINRGFLIYTISQFTYTFALGVLVLGTNSFGEDNMNGFFYFAVLPLAFILLYRSQRRYFLRKKVDLVK